MKKSYTAPTVQPAGNVAAITAADNAGSFTDSDPAKMQMNM